MVGKQLYYCSYFFIIEVKHVLLFFCTMERSSCMCMTKKETQKQSQEQKFIMLPSVDFCFQELMEDKEILKGFCGAILNVTPEEIGEIELLPKRLRKRHKEEKYGILDVHVCLKNGERMNIEMQSISYDYWQERSLFYLAKMYTDQIHEGEDYDNLKKCIHVGILDFNLFEHDRYYSRFHIWEDTSHELYTDKFEIHILELPKLAKYEYPQTELLHWAQFFGAKSREELQMLAGKDEYIQKAYKRLEEMSVDEQKRWEYEMRQKAIRDHRHMLASGKREGLREGRIEGKIEMVQKMLADKMPLDKVIEYSGLSLEEIQKLIE